MQLSDLFRCAFQFSRSLNRGGSRISDTQVGSDEAEQPALSSQGCKPNRLELAMYRSTFGVQHCGTLLKQSKRKNRAAKWNKRCFNYLN